jgi:hypothetical protein
VRRSLVGAAVALAMVLSPTTPATADTGTTAAGGGATDPSIGTGSSDVSLSLGGGSGSVSCQYSSATPTNGVGSAEVFDPVPGQTYFLVCIDGNGNVVFADFVVYNPVAPIDPATLARQAWRQLPLVFPDARTSPDRSRSQYVGLPTWLWVDQSDWQPRSATASVPGLSATVTATPTRIEWELGDGRGVEVCDAGTPYDATKPAASQSTNCSHTFMDASSVSPDRVFHAMATMWWTVQWQATDGSSGTLPDAFRSTTFDVRVDEIQALRTGGTT